MILEDKSLVSFNNSKKYSLLVNLTRNCLLFIASVYIFVYIVIALYRIWYPFEIEWLEGAIVDHIRRICEGKSLYTKPSLDFIPFIYTPLYFYLSALLSKIVGIGLLAPRLISFFSSLGCFALIFLIVKRETNDKLSAFLSTGLFAATFKISGKWFDIARVDSLFLMLFLVCIYMSRHKSETSILLAALFAGLSFLTKQTALFMSIAIALYYIFTHYRHFFVFTIILFLIVVGTTLIFNHLTNGWYSYYVFTLPSQHKFMYSMLIPFWKDEIFSHLPIACILSIFFFLIDNSNKNHQRLFYFLLSIGMLGSACLSRLHSGSSKNSLMPAYVIISILFGLSIHKILELSSKKIILYLICIAQFGILLYNPLSQVPTQKDLKRAKEFIIKIKKIQGDIWVPYHGYIPFLAEKKTYAHVAAIWDVLRSNTRPKFMLIDEIKKSLKNGDFKAIILGDSIPDVIRPYIEDYYDKKQGLWPPVKGPFEYVYIRKLDTD